MTKSAKFADGIERVEATSPSGFKMILEPRGTKTYVNYTGSYYLTKDLEKMISNLRAKGNEVNIIRRGL